MNNKSFQLLKPPSQRNLLNYSMILLALYVSWGFVFTYTIIASPLYVYVSFLTLFLLFGVSFLKYGQSATPISVSWIPFILYTIFGYLMNGSLENAIYWMICLIMLCIGRRSNYLSFIPYKILFWSGIVAVVGVLFQLFFPGIYYAYISNIFTTSDQIDSWSEGYGLAGFTYQVGCTSAIIIYGEAVLLSMKDKILSNKYNKELIYYFILILMILGVFLTGKRMLSIIAVGVPFFLYFFAKRKSSTRMFLFVLLGCFVLVAFNIFVSNIELLSDSLFFRRFASSYVEMKMGDDITSQRAYLYDLAIRAFNKHPYFGIGVGNYISYTGAYTSAHNTYLQTLCEQGVFGFTLYVIPLVYCLFYSISLIKREYNLYVISYIKFSIAIQLIYILWAFTGNMNVGTSFVFYFMAIALTDKIRSLKISKK